MNCLAVCRFLDVHEVERNGQKVTEASAELHQHVLDLQRQVEANVSREGLRKYEVEWRGGISADSHAAYLDEFADDFLQTTKKSIDRAVHKHSMFRSDDLYSEVLQHLVACKNHVRHFQGRSEIINRIRDYVTGDSNSESFELP